MDQNLRVNNRNKHIDRKYHFVKDEISKGAIEIRYVNTSELEASIMIKNFSYEIISKSVTNMELFRLAKIL